MNTTYNKSQVMSRAWRIFRAYPNLSWSVCLTRSWSIEKESEKDITPAVMNKILNGLRTFNRSRNPQESKPLMSGTQEHFKLLNSRTGRRIMKSPSQNDSKEMLETGELFGLDIMHQRRKESRHFTTTTHKIKNTFRNRIINSETCVAINIQEYINGNH
jgi:hypothetical protein